MKTVILMLLFSLPAFSKTYTFKIDYSETEGTKSVRKKFEVRSALGKKFKLTTIDKTIVILPTLFDEGLEGEAIYYQATISDGKQILASPEMISFLGDESSIESRDLKTGERFSLKILGQKN